MNKNTNNTMEVNFIPPGTNVLTKTISTDLGSYVCTTYDPPIHMPDEDVTTSYVEDGKTYTKTTKYFKVAENACIQPDDMDGSNKHFDFQYIIEQPQGDDLRSVVQVSELGLIAIPEAIRLRVGIESKQCVTVILEDADFVIVLGEDVFGYDDCEKWVRHVDELGRVVVPIQIRKFLGITPTNLLELTCNEENEIVATSNY